MTTEAVVPPTARPPELLGQTVLVIGGSAGIGLETARRARAEGADVILAARNPERLQHAASELGAVSTATFDADDSDALEAFFEHLEGPIDHVLATGGGPYYAPLADMDFDEARRDLQKHPMLMLGVARYASPKVRPGGTLLFIGGTGGRKAAHWHAHRSGDSRATPAHGRPGARNRAGAGQPHRRWLRRHAAVGVAPRRQARRAPRGASRDAADRPCGRPGGRGGPRRSHHGEHRFDRRDLRHRRRPAIRLRVSDVG